ncbi:hypothetical protein [uncultured Arcticibacterium sp.]|uniref:hypothetical protein n=1 Tax=uncultured Arcticibacterium sp. TaxID=2173042 RepID=UPI0030FAC0F0
MESSFGTILVLLLSSDSYKKMAKRGDFNQFEQKEGTTIESIENETITEIQKEASVNSLTSSFLWHNFRSFITRSGKICLKNWLKSIFIFFLEQNLIADDTNVYFKN